MKYVAIAITALGLAIGGCGKKEEAPKTPPPAEPVAANPTPAEPTPAPAEPAVAEPAPAEPAPVEPAPVVDRAAALIAGFALYNEHKLDEAAANFAEGVVGNYVGDPMMPIATGREAVLANDRALLAGFPDIKVTPVRVYEAGEWVVAEVVMTGTHSAAFRGMEPTNKPFGIAAAMAYHFAADGKIDRFDQFVDAATMMMQIGAVPTPAMMGELKLVAAPEGAPAIIKGEPSQAHQDLVTALNADFKADTIEAAWDKYFAADFVYTSANEGLALATKDENLAYMKKMMFAMFPDWAGKAEQMLSVGDRVISWSVSTATYKGGMEGIEAKDQKLTLHGLDFWTLADGKVKAYTMYGNGLEFMAQLGMIGGAGGDKGADAAIEGAVEAAGAAGDAAKAAVEGANAAVEGAKAAAGAADEAVKAAGEEMKKAGEEMKKAGDALKGLGH